MPAVVVFLAFLLGVQWVTGALVQYYPGAMNMLSR